MKSVFVFLMLLIIQPAHSGCHWTKNTNKLIPVTELKIAFRTLELCKEECEKDPHCDKGIDYWPAMNYCYFSRDGFLTIIDGYDHYNCLRPGEYVPGRVLRLAVPRKGCIWTKHKDKNTWLADLQMAFATLESCKEGCENDPHCDLGIDYWPVKNDCYFTRNDGLDKYPGFDHYSCSLNCKWRISPGMKSIANILNEVHDDPFWDCAEACIIIPEKCAGIDYIPPLNNQRETCYFYGKDNINMVYTHESSVHFAKDCGCLWKYKGKSGKNYHYLKSLFTPITLETCKDECLEDEQCQTGIHWDPKEQECYFGADLTVVFENWSKSYVHEEFDHYLCEF